MFQYTDNLIYKGSMGKMEQLRKNWSYVKNIQPIIMIFGRNTETMTIQFNHENDNTIQSRNVSIYDYIIEI